MSEIKPQSELAMVRAVLELCGIRWVRSEGEGGVPGRCPLLRALLRLCRYVIVQQPVGAVRGRHE